MKTSKTNKLILGLLAAVGLAAPSLADIFDLNWYTIDGGGFTYSTGGEFSLGGTIGQPDAGVMSGGDFSLGGGFWHGGAVQNPCSGTVKGDSNCDGEVNFDDIDCFVSALIDKAAWEACGSDGKCDYECANDVDGDGDVNFNDIDPFVTCIINEGCQ